MGIAPRMEPRRYCIQISKFTILGVATNMFVARLRHMFATKNSPYIAIAIALLQMFPTYVCSNWPPSLIPVPRWVKVTRRCGVFWGGTVGWDQLGFCEIL